MLSTGVSTRKGGWSRPLHVRGQRLGVAETPHSRFLGCSVYFSVHVCFSLCGAMTPITVARCPPKPCLRVPSGGLSAGKTWACQARKTGRNEKGEAMRLSCRDFHQALPSRTQTQASPGDSGRHPELVEEIVSDPNPIPFILSMWVIHCIQETWHS